MAEGPARVYLGTFCTGHTPMVGSTAIQFEENSKHEFVEEYKKAHGMNEKKGPGIGYIYDFRAQPRRESPALPIAGCNLARLNTGNYAARRAPTSSQQVGSWWTDSVLQNIKVEEKRPGDKGKPPACLGISTSSDLGRFFHDPELDERDPIMDKLRAQNGCKRVLPVEDNSQFALEDIAIADRLL